MAALRPAPRAWRSAVSEARSALLRWLNHLDEKGGLERYVPAISRYYATPDEVLNDYIVSVDGELFFDSGFFEDMGVEDPRHQELFEGWFELAALEGFKPSPKVKATTSPRATSSQSAWAHPQGHQADPAPEPRSSWEQQGWAKEEATGSWTSKDWHEGPPRWEANDSQWRGGAGARWDWSGWNSSSSSSWGNRWDSEDQWQTGSAAPRWGREEEPRPARPAPEEPRQEAQQTRLLRPSVRAPDVQQIQRAESFRPARVAPVEPRAAAEPRRQPVPDAGSYQSNEGHRPNEGNRRRAQGSRTVSAPARRRNRRDVAPPAPAPPPPGGPLDQWLLSLEPAGALRQYGALLGEFFEHQEQVFLAYTMLEGDASGKSEQLVFDPGFFNEIGVSKEEHKAIFLQWFEARCAAGKTSSASSTSAPSSVKSGGTSRGSEASGTKPRQEGSLLASPPSAPAPKPPQVANEAAAPETKSHKEPQGVPLTSKDAAAQSPKRAPSRQPQAKVAEPEVQTLGASSSRASSAGAVLRSAPGKVNEVAKAGSDVASRLRQAQEAASKLPEMDPRPQVTVVFLGQSGAGKSALLGALLRVSGAWDARTFEKFVKENRQTSTSSSSSAPETRVEHFSTESRRFTLLDPSGHSRCVQKAWQAAAQADVAVLVVSAVQRELEAGLSKGRQTREHALLAKSLGIENLVVAVNKMDECLDGKGKWSNLRYEETRGDVWAVLRSVGYMEDQVTFVPVSAGTGDNLGGDDDDDDDCEVCADWYSGDPLLEVLEGAPLPERDGEAPLAALLLQSGKRGGNAMATARILQGHVEAGATVVAIPGGAECGVLAVEANGRDVRRAGPGDVVRLTLLGPLPDGATALSCPEAPLRAAAKLKVQLKLVESLEENPLLTPGFRCVLHLAQATAEVEVSKLLEAVEPKARKKEANPKFVKAPMVALCVLVLDKEVAVEVGSGVLSRFCLRTDAGTIAVGKVADLPKVSK